MCRLLGYCSRGSASVAGLLTEEGLGAFTALSAYHCDGWGMAWYDSDGPQVRKSPRRAAEEPEYSRLAERALGDLGLVHLRWATPGLGIGYPNSHPFRFGPYTFAHNGAVHPQDRLGEMLPGEWEARLAGTTDSERYLLHIMWRLEVRRGDMIAAVADSVASIAERYAVNSLNAVLLSPGKMYVISWHDPARIPADELRRRGLASTPEEIAGYFHLACLTTPDAVVVASSGWPQPGWTTLPNNSVLVVDRVTLDKSSFSLEPALRSPAGRLPARGLATLITDDIPFHARKIVRDHGCGGWAAGPWLRAGGSAGRRAPSDCRPRTAAGAAWRRCSPRAFRPRWPR
jgi:predicted glutamine amidotransferase